MGKLGELGRWGKQGEEAIEGGIKEVRELADILKYRSLCVPKDHLYSQLIEQELLSLPAPRLIICEPSFQYLSSPNSELTGPCGEPQVYLPHQLQQGSVGSSQRRESMDSL